MAVKTTLGSAPATPTLPKAAVAVEPKLEEAIAEQAKPGAQPANDVSEAKLPEPEFITVSPEDFKAGRNIAMTPWGNIAVAPGAMLVKVGKYSFALTPLAFAAIAAKKG